MARRRPMRFPQTARKTTWIGPADGAFADVASNAGLLVQIFDPQGSGMMAPTVVRTRGEVAIRPSDGVIVDLEVVGAFGLCVVSDQAAAAGIASIPVPFTDAQWDGWFVWRSFHYVQEAAGTVANLVQNFRTLEVDSKAMRKVNTNETVCMVAESQSGAFQISMPLRTLFKLS